MALTKKMKNNLIISLVLGGVLGAIATGFALLTRESFMEANITSWNINATLEEDGDLHVIDTIEFKSEDYHFFEYEIGYGKNIIDGNGTQSYFDYDSVKVSVYNKEKHYYFKDQSQATSNSADNYKRSDCLGFSWNPNDREHDGVRLDYYTSGSRKELIYVYLYDGLDKTIYFQYEYTIKNALNKYDDVSELNWQFASPLEGMGIKNIDLTLNLPEDCSKYTCSTSWDEEGIMAFGHGNGGSEMTTFSNTKIETHTSQLYGDLDEVLELRVVIPNDSYDVFDKVDEDDMIASSLPGKEILKTEEERLANLDLEYTIMYNATLTSFIGINSILLIAMCLIISIIYRKFDKERVPVFDSEYLREPPTKMMPSFLSYLVNEKEITTESFTSNIISLVRKNYLKIDSNNSVLTDKKANYLLTRNFDTSANEPLNSDESFLLDLLFNKMFTNQAYFTLEDLEKKLKEESSALTFTTAIERWRKDTAVKAESLNYYDKLKGIKSFLIVGLIGILFGMYSLFVQYLNYYLPVYLSILPASVFGLGIFFCLYINSVNRKSVTGIEEYTKWMAFKKFLTDFSHFEDYDVMSVTIWEDYLIYANVFGIADLVEKQMRVKLKDMPTEYNNSAYYYNNNSLFFLMHMNRVSRRISSYSNLAKQTVAASKAARNAGRISGSGGFGGSSSRGGGGHGGRAG